MNDWDTPIRKLAVVPSGLPEAPVVPRCQPGTDEDSLESRLRDHALYNKQERCGMFIEAANEIAALKSRVEELKKALEPFAKAADGIPDKLPDDLWTHCSSYSYQMSEAEFAHLKESGVPLLDRRVNLTLWIDGHPLSDFRNARRALAMSLEDRK